MSRKDVDLLREEILTSVRGYSSQAFRQRDFVPGESAVPVSGKVFDGDELALLVDASLDFWLTTGRFADQFESEFASLLGLRHASLCNSGSSANLLALSALTSAKLGDQRLKPGDEVITTAACFPTTLGPIVQCGLVPVMLDIDEATCNIDVSRLEEAVGPRTRAIIAAHTLGNPFDIDAVLKVAGEHGLWVIEDNCDALGSRYRGKLTGTFGDLATSSFYPAHHITMGEGGCVVTNQPVLKTLVESFRDWGRDCWCPPGKDNTCGKRFEWQLGNLPFAYDHKYTYSHIGYNLKLTDMQAAIGVAQLKKLPGFIEQRRRNWKLLADGLAPFSEYLHLPHPQPGSEPSWFGFLTTVKAEAPFARQELVQFLEERKIATRLLFAGDITRQPAYMEIPRRVVGPLTQTEHVMNHAFWIGVYPGVTPAMIDYVVDTFSEFFAGFK